jgi:hypothetical protein
VALGWRGGRLRGSRQADGGPRSEGGADEALRG